MVGLLSKGTKRTIVITGPPQSGKKFAAQSAAGYADLTPFLHVSSESAGQLQLARTIALWFKYVDDHDIQLGASDVLEHLDARRWSRAHDSCVELLNLAASVGLKCCFLVDRVQFLDNFSFSVIRECLDRRGKQGRELQHSWSSRLNSTSESSERDGDNEMGGRVCFLCVHVALYQSMSAEDVAKRLAKAYSRRRAPIITLGRVSDEDLRLLFRDLSDMDVHDRWLRTYAETSGYCAGYFVERAAASRTISGYLWSQGKKGLAITNGDMILQIPTGMVRKNRTLTVHQVSADIAMKYTQIFDELPALFQVSYRFYPVENTFIGSILTLDVTDLFEGSNDGNEGWVFPDAETVDVGGVERSHCRGCR